MNKVILFAACLAGSILSANAQSSIAVSNNIVKVQKNVATAFAVQLNNTDDISALQANFTAVPENITINGATTATENGDSLKYSAVSNLKSPVVVTYNFTNATTPQAAFATGKVFNVSVTADENFTMGEMTMTPIASKIGGEGVTISPITVKVLKNGDAVTDGFIDGKDVVAVRNNVLNAEEYIYLGDVNDDEVVDGKDVVALRNGVLDATMAKAGQVDLGE